MQYKTTVPALFLNRPNRFVAEVLLKGKKETVHVKNTGRCKELLLPNSEVILAKGDNPARKTAYDLVAVKKENVGWINIDSQAPNTVMGEWLRRAPVPFAPLDFLKPEYVFGDSRVDFYLESGKRKILIEVKGCTLEKEGIGYFPDAPTERGIKHLNELAKGVAMGYECYIAFVIPVPGVREVLPNAETHPAFCTAYYNAMQSGVKVMFLPCNVTPEGFSVKECIFPKIKNNP